ncbi:hypothetical protein A5769_13120 [Mycobacterium intracellulare]|nr:hypothetical protein A5769_13120 [Mycobacterium intracellulare]
MFERDDMTLEQAQIAKVDLTLDSLDLAPGTTLLDIGCGWGSTLKRAIQRYDVHVIGLTLSLNQHAYTQQLLDRLDTSACCCVAGSNSTSRGSHREHRSVRGVRRSAFGKQRYAAFFEMAYTSLPREGRIVLETIFTQPKRSYD